jgi:hypothetical protein
MNKGIDGCLDYCPPKFKMFRLHMLPRVQFEREQDDGCTFEGREKPRPGL